MKIYLRPQISISVRFSTDVSLHSFSKYVFMIFIKLLLLLKVILKGLFLMISSICSYEVISLDLWLNPYYPEIIQIYDYICIKSASFGKNPLCKATLITTPNCSWQQNIVSEQFVHLNQYFVKIREKNPQASRSRFHRRQSLPAASLSGNRKQERGAGQQQMWGAFLSSNPAGVKATKGAISQDTLQEALQLLLGTGRGRGTNSSPPVSLGPIVALGELELPHPMDAQCEHWTGLTARWQRLQGAPKGREEGAAGSGRLSLPPCEGTPPVAAGSYLETKWVWEAITGPLTHPL